MNEPISPRRDTLLPGLPSIPPRVVYLVILVGGVAFSMSLGFAVFGVYVVTEANLNAFQLVLAGTVLELSVFVAEIPTGVVADVYSRRLSVIIGVALIGLGVMVTGIVPAFWAVALGSATWGIGHTFTSGAKQAWLSDEIGEGRASAVFLRGSQVSRIARLLGLPAGVLIGRADIMLPFMVGGGAFLVLAVILLFVMTERGYAQTATDDRDTWSKFADTLAAGLRTVRVRPLLIMLLIIVALLGMSSEAFDRLAPKHLLDSFIFPTAFSLDEVTWFGMFSAVSLVGGIAVTEVVRRSVDITRPNAIVFALMVLTIGIMASFVSFAVAGVFWAAVVAFLVVGWLRAALDPLLLAWVNRRLDSRTRATVLSMLSQSDALGQVTGGPAFGLVATLRSVRTTLVLGAIVIAPSLPIFAYMLRSSEEQD